MPSSRRIVPIKYTSRDFQTIKEDLVEYAKRYYPDTFRDFNEAGFGALMLDTVAYVGDILSFYLDYQANESFLDTAIEYTNVVKLGRQLGHRFPGSPTSHGTVALYILVPANADQTGPDDDYLPLLSRGASFSSTSGIKYMLNEEVNFAHPSNEIVVADVDSTTGTPITYAVKAFGQVISGEIAEQTVAIGTFQRFRKIAIPDDNIVEVISIFDSEGHQYFEVENLSQNVVFVEVQNQGSNNDTVKNIIKPIVVPRRYTVIHEVGATFIQFGYGSEENLRTNLITDPSDIAFDIHGRNYVSDTSFDPSRLTKTDKFGIVPVSTTLTIAYRRNAAGRVNTAAETITTVKDHTFVFPSQEQGTELNGSSISSVVTSLEVINPDPVIGGVSLPSSDELKIRIFGNFAAQNRAVTHQDYESLIYTMPSQFGAVKRVRVVQDLDSFKRNLNLYVVSEDINGSLIKTNSTIKRNLKAWINKYKMLNDTIDVLDAHILNIGIDFTAVSLRNANRFDVLTGAKEYLRSYVLSRTYEIGERFYISDIYQVLRGVPGLLDVVDVTITQRTGVNYSNIPLDIEDRTDPDGRYIDVPKNVIVEVKFPDNDVRGTVR